MKAVHLASIWMRCGLFLGLGLARGSCAFGQESDSAEALLFSPERISRHSLDQLPRSLSIRQGEGTWLGYDLEKGKIYKVWEAPAGKTGLQPKGFVVGSVGVPLFQDKTEATWQLQRDGRAIPLRIRYLGVTERGVGADKHFLLSWELRHDQGRLELVEKVPVKGSPQSRVTRLLRVIPLASGEALAPPPSMMGVWKIDGKDLGRVALSNQDWHELTLSSTASISGK